MAPTSKEYPLFFARDGARLFGMLHFPDTDSSKSAFILSHPFGEEKLWSHRVYVSLARALASRGSTVLRFDYMGAGDSSGMTSDTSMDTHLADLKAAFAALRTHVPEVNRVGIVGLRLGASFAALLAEAADTDPALSVLGGAPLVLWDPVVDGAAYFQELLRSNLSTQLAVYGKVIETREALQERIRAGGLVNVDGYEIGSALFESCARADLLEPGPRKHSGPVLVVQIASSEKTREREDLSALSSAYATGEFARTLEQPFWREIRRFYGRADNLQELALSWLEKCDERDA